MKIGKRSNILTKKPHIQVQELYETALKSPTIMEM